MSFIVFGGSGFVGRYLVDELLKKDAVVIADVAEPLYKYQVYSNVSYAKVDVRDKKTFNKIEVKKGDVVINLAANQYHTKVPKKNRAAYFSDTNTGGVKNILSWMEERGLDHLIQYTTDMTYGKPQYLPVDTKHPQVPFGPYGQSKKDAEDICREYRKKGFHITIFRPRMINGPGRLGILKKLFVLIDHGLPVATIGNGKNCYQMISVFDCVSATVLAIEQGCPNMEFNLGSENVPTTHVLLKNLARNVGSKSLIIPTPGKFVKYVLAFLGFVGIEIMYKEQYMIADENYILDISQTKDELGWKPMFNDQDMLIQSYKEWKNSQVKDY